MAWNYDKDEVLLSERATNEAVDAVLRYNSLMAFSSADCGSKKDLLSAANFLEMCKVKINKVVDEKIAVMKERAK